jgi:hypothetical protein
MAPKTRPAVNCSSSTIVEVRPCPLLASSVPAETTRSLGAPLGGLFPRLQLGEHLLAETAPRVPEEHHGHFSPEVLKLHGLALEVRECYLGDRLADLGSGWHFLLGVAVGVDLAAQLGHGSP